MKKRLTLIITSIVCICVTLALVTYSVVTSIKKQEPTPDVPTTDVNIENPVDGENNGEDQNQGAENPENPDIPVVTPTAYNVGGIYYVGDTFSDEILKNNFEAWKEGLSFVDFDAETGVFVFNAAGQFSYANTTADQVYACNYDFKVVNKGTGTKEDPFNAINADSFVNLVKNNNTETTFIALQNDIDFANVENFEPIDYRGNLNGNNFTIKNVKMIVTEQNKSNFSFSVSGNPLFVAGLFGRLGQFTTDVVEKSVIENINLDGVTIDTSALTAERDINYTYSRIGAFASEAKHVNINNINVKNVNIISNIGKPNASVNSVIGSVVGNLTNSVMQNCVVENSNVDYNGRGVRIAGIAGMLINSEINTAEVNGFVVNATRNADDTALSKIAGAIARIDANSTIENVNVRGIKVSAVAKAAVSGLVDINLGTIRDSAVADIDAQESKLAGTIAAGFVNQNEGVIEFTSEKALTHAVNVKYIIAQTKLAGMFIQNTGKVLGNSEQNTIISARLVWSPLDANFLKSGETVEEKYMMAGIGVTSTGEISNITTIVNMVEPIVAAAGVGFASGKIDACSLNTTVTVIKDNIANGIVRNSNVKTYYVSGFGYKITNNINMNVKTAVWFVRAEGVTFEEITNEIVIAHNFIERAEGVVIKSNLTYNIY